MYTPHHLCPALYSQPCFRLTCQWYMLERGYARIPVDWMAKNGVTMNFDDMIPLCVYGSSTTGPSGNDVGINTGVMDKYLKFSIIEELKGADMGKTPKDAQENWRQYAKCMEWVTTKTELAYELQQFHVLREFAVSPPWAPIPTVGDHTCELYLMHPFEEVQLRYAQSDYFVTPVSLLMAKQKAEAEGGTWVSRQDTQVRVVDTLFTRTTARNNLHHPRGLMLGVSSPIAGRVCNKLWFFSLKLKSEGAGHFMKQWPLGESTQLEARSAWAFELGMLGVLLLVSEELCASSLQQLPPYAKVREALAALRTGPLKVTTLSYARLMDTFPIKILKDKEVLLGKLELRKLKALSLHSDVPSVSSDVRSLKLCPAWPALAQLGEEEEEEEEEEAGAGDADTSIPAPSSSTSALAAQTPPPSYPRSSGRIVASKGRMVVAKKKKQA